MTPERRLDLAALALIILGMLRIASAWTTFSATVDEPMHISAGLELLTNRTYTYQLENPPLPRVVFALAPALGGMEFDPAKRKDLQLLEVFHSRGRYKTNLVLARCGNLLFFAIGSLAVWAWARRELGALGGLAATLLFTMQPPIVAHAGVATHDMAATASLAVSLLAFSRWLDRPTLARAAACGAAFGFAALCKFSSLGYVPAACVAMYVVRLVRDEETRRAWRRVIPSLLGAAAVTILVIWIGYAFHMTPFLDGIRILRWVSRSDAYYAFLFGEVRSTGWWYYFPVAVALKATLASLLLLFFVRGRGAEPLAAALAILAVAMPSHLNLGVRYVLPIFAPLAVAGAAGALAALRDKRVLRIAAIALLVWHTGASLFAHPDTLPYFNELAGRRPWRLLLDSNVDWGQDILRLREVVREKKIERIGIAALGWFDWEKLGFPPVHQLARDHPTQGWVAISEHAFGVARSAPWLEGRRYERVGKSIRLYYLP